MDADKLYLEYRFASGWVLSGIVDRDEARGVIRMANNLNEPAGAICSGMHISVVLQDQELLEQKGSDPSEAPDFHRRTTP